MEIGEKKTFIINPDEAFGKKRQALIDKVSVDKFPDEITPEIGKTLKLKQLDGSTVSAKITDVDDKEVTLDANHAFAGMSLRFEVELAKIESNSE